jgi:hypothetical protein
MVHRANFQDGHAALAVQRFDVQRQSPLVVMGAALFIDYIFRCWPFRKLYMEVAEYNVGQFGRGIERIATEEGRLREHLWYDGRYWDEVIYALYRDSWQALNLSAYTVQRPATEHTVRVRIPAPSPPHQQAPRPSGTDDDANLTLQRG